MELPQGWDSHTRLVEGRWIHRRPRRAEVADRLRREAGFLPWLADRLPLAVPRPVVARAEPLLVRHELVPGEATEKPTAAQGAALGEFLRALHAADVAEAVARGLTDAEETRRERAETLARFRELVLPRLSVERRTAGEALLAAVAELPADAVVHGDLGPEHVLSEGGRLSGVIDFTDAHVGDRALDLAWALHGTPGECAAALARAYGVDAALRERALVWHRLGPWFEVVHGIEQGDAEEIESGLAGVESRLD